MIAIQRIRFLHQAVQIAGTEENFQQRSPPHSCEIVLEDDGVFTLMKRGDVVRVPMSNVAHYVECPTDNGARSEPEEPSYSPIPSEAPIPLIAKRGPGRPRKVAAAE